MASNTLDHMAQQGHEQSTGWPPNFLKILPYVSMLKKHGKFCRHGMTHLNATPTLKNRLETYETPCKYMILCSISKHLKIDTCFLSP